MAGSQSKPGLGRRFRRAEHAFADAAERWLPNQPGGIWRTSAFGVEGLPRQGWKLHVSASLFEAAETLDRIGPVLVGAHVHFKGAMNLAELKKLNCGLFYGYSQVGKFVTVYPADDAAAVRIGQALVAATRGMAAPDIPLERRLAEGAPVFARYGLFSGGGQDEPALLEGPDGPELDSRSADPAWAKVPDGLFTPLPRRPKGALATHFRVFDILSQRGKGGVYKAVDLTGEAPRLCLVKEGRALGEVDIDGSDGRSRVAHEAIVLQALRAAGLPVPAVLAAFAEDGHQYLALEWIDGTSLIERLAAAEPPLSEGERLRLGLSAARLLTAIHAAGWVWRDLKAANFLVDSQGRLRPIDFEGAAPARSRVSSPWGSPGHMAPEVMTQLRAAKAQDLFALGAMLCHVLTGDIAALTVDAVRSGHPETPAVLVALIERLMAPDARHRPRAATAAAILDRVCAACS